jgi:hypothetical protein
MSLGFIVASQQRTRLLLKVKASSNAAGRMLCGRKCVWEMGGILQKGPAIKFIAFISINQLLL